MEYDVADDVSVESATQAGLERHSFKKGRVTPADDDEHYFLEYVLVPAGLAERVESKKRRKKEEDAPVEPEVAPEPVEDAPVADPQESQ